MHSVIIENTEATMKNKETEDRGGGHEENIMFEDKKRQYHNICTGGSCLSQIFWEHANLSGLSVIWLISTNLH